MITNYFKTAWRNLIKGKTYSIINVLGLTMGLAVVLLIAIWIWDELSFNKSFKNYDRIAMVLKKINNENGVSIGGGMPIPLATALRNNYKHEFSGVSLQFGGEYNLNVGDKKFSQQGIFVEPDWPEIFSLKMVSGSAKAIADPSSILISQTLAQKFFGNENPLNQIIRITGHNITVAGVYKDFPVNTDLSKTSFIGPWSFLVNHWDWIKNEKNSWNFSAFILNVQLAPGANMQTASQSIKNILAQQGIGNNAAKTEQALLLYPMRRWHLYDHFDEAGNNTGGFIQYIRLFGAIGLFVLLLACINFMNLSTARSQKRAKEVGIRKAVGSSRRQLMLQFFTESVFTTFASLLLALVLVGFAIPWFNGILGRDMNVSLLSPSFWIIAVATCFITGLIAGSYPALYLSSFKPVKVLKGLFKVGASATIPRRVLVILQFFISISLVIATVIIYKQVQFAKNRHVGYNANGLLSVHMSTKEIYDNYNTLRNELIQSGAISDMAQSQSPATERWAGDNGFEWKGKSPTTPDGFGIVSGSLNFGNMVGWQFMQGRGFSQNFATDSMGLVLNESAVKYMGLKNPVGEMIKWHGINYTVLGVIKDVIMHSPFGENERIVFSLLKEGGNYVVMRINPGKSVSDAVKTIGDYFQKYNPQAQFEYTFVDDDYAKKFKKEEDISKLVSVFSVFAILISLLGLFGIASFMAEQRTKEVGVRKVLGASIPTLWKLLSKELVYLVIIAILIAIPLCYWAMSSWLNQYPYRTKLTVGIFLIPALFSLVVALITVSLQTIKAALANPVKSLRTE